MPTLKIKLMTEDKQILIEDSDLFECSSFIRTRIQQLGLKNFENRDTPIELLVPSSLVMAKIIEWLKYHEHELAASPSSDQDQKLKKANKEGLINVLEEYVDKYGHRLLQFKVKEEPLLRPKDMDTWDRQFFAKIPFKMLLEMHSAAVELGIPRLIKVTASVGVVFAENFSEDEIRLMYEKDADLDEGRGFERSLPDWVRCKL